MSRVLTIPLTGYRGAISLQLPESTLSESDWAVLMAVLQAMKPALVEPDVANAAVADVHDLTPDERIEVARALRQHLALVGPPVRRGTDLAAVADRLDWFEREPS